MEPVEGSEPKSRLQAAKEPLSLRFLLAFSAATVLTAAVAVPMAFQAYLAREDQRAAMAERPAIAVLGSTTVPAEQVVPDEGLVHAASPDGERLPLQGATLTDEFHLFLELEDVVRVDFVLDDEPPVTDRTPPWRPFPDDGAPSSLPAGDHVLVATVTFTDGRVEVRQASFIVVSD